MVEAVGRWEEMWAMWHCPQVCRVYLPPGSAKRFPDMSLFFFSDCFKLASVFLISLHSVCAGWEIGKNATPTGRDRSAGRVDETPGILEGPSQLHNYYVCMCAYTHACTHACVYIMHTLTNTVQIKLSRPSLSLNTRFQRKPAP